MFWRRKPRHEPEFLIFGLGNPGLRYANTRHNIGWWVLDELARRGEVSQTTSRHRSQVDYCKLAGTDCALIKPTTFMNRSGQCVAPWLREHSDARWLVIADDITMKPGKLRFRQQGSSGGHKGIQSIIDTFGSDELDRLKIGVGAPPSGVDAAEWVLEAPLSTEEDLLAEAIHRTAEAVLLLIANNHDALNKLMGAGQSVSDKQE